MIKLKHICDLLTVVSAITICKDIMIKTFKWYEKKYGK